MKVLDGYPMQFNVTARRSGDEWFIGACTLSARTIDIKLSELIGDGEYNAYIFGDNADGSALEIKKVEGLTSKDTITQKLLANGGCVIKLTKHEMNLTTPYSNYKFYEAESAKLGGGAKLTTGKDAKYSSGSAYVGYIGGSGGGSVTFSNVKADKDGEYPIRIYYISGERRSLKVDVNGQFAVKLDDLFANQGDWSGIRAITTTVKLKAGDNTIKLYNDAGNAPSIDRIALAIPLDKPKGDINLDGQVSAADLVCMERYLLKAEKFSKQQFEAADLDGDGRVDTFDLIHLRKILTA